MTDSLKANVGYTFTKAELDQEFTTPDGAFGAANGAQLPGVPENTAVASLHYSTEFDGVMVDAQLGFSYKDEITTGYELPSIFHEAGYDVIEASTLWNATVNMSKDEWTVGLFAQNLLNVDDATASDGDGKYIIENGETKAGEQYDISQLGDQRYRVRPRKIGVSISYSF